MIYFLSLCYFFVRLINLTRIPVFNDEAIYLDWGQRAFLLPNQLYFSLLDSKQPLLIWVFGLSSLIFHDPLWAGRIISVFAGFLSMLAIYFISKTYFNRETAIISCLLFIFSPLFAFFDRQALMESTITAVGLWSIFLYIKLDRKKTFRWAIFLGAVLGLGLFIKTSAVIFLTTILFLLLIKRKFYDLSLIAVASQLIVAPLYLQPNFWSTLETNSRYSLTLYEISRLPFSVWFNNIKLAFEIAFWHLTPFVFLSMIGGIFFTFRSNKKNVKIFWLFFIPCLIFLTVARDVTPRYLEPFLPLSAVFSALFINSVYQKIKLIKYPSLIVVFALPVVITLLQIFQPLNYFSFLDRLTKQSQKFQYVNGWTSGYGIKEAIQYLNDKKQKSIAGVRLDTGNPESAVFAYLRGTEKITPVYFDRKMFGNQLTQADCINTKLPLYFISRDRQLADLDKYLVEEKLFYKPGKESYVGVFRLKKGCRMNILNLTF